MSHGWGESYNRIFHWMFTSGKPKARWDTFPSAQVKREEAWPNEEVERDTSGMAKNTGWCSHRGPRHLWGWVPGTDMSTWSKRGSRKRRILNWPVFTQEKLSSMLEFTVYFELKGLRFPSSVERGAWNICKSRNTIHM